MNCRSAVTTLILIALLTGLSAYTKDGPFVDESEPAIQFIEPEEPWQETAIEIPALPKDKDLVEFKVDDPQGTFSYAIDRQSVSVAEDGIVRYTLVIESAQGVRNISYEGLRCGTNEYKVYAYGGSNGAMRPRKAPQWMAIKEDRSTRVHRDLVRYYFCEPTLQNALERSEILRALKGQLDIRQPNFLKPW